MRDVKHTLYDRDAVVKRNISRYQPLRIAVEQQHTQGY
jgi:hypothetical protein